MAKEDFCFTYYDGDAARDKAHMSRLERGAYDDIISAQRKRGHLCLDDIKKVLSKDFDECWPSLEWVLKIDAEQKFFIEWVDKSLEKMRLHSKKQKEKASKRWHDSGNPERMPRHNHGIHSAVPLEDGDGKEEGFKERGTGETMKGSAVPIVPAMMDRFKQSNPDYLFDQDVDFPSLRLIAQKIHAWLKLKNLYDDPKNAEEIKLRWGEVVDLVRSDSHYSTYSITRLNKHFQSITQSFSNGRSKADKQAPPAKLGTSEARTEAAKKWGLSAGEQIP